MTDDCSISRDFIQEFGRENPKMGLQRAQQLVGAVKQPAIGNIGIVGTNGKGSMGRSLALILNAMGFTTLRFQSPHIRSVRERVLHDEQMLPHKFWEQSLAQLAKFDSPHGRLSYFEAVFGVATLALNTTQYDYAIWEAGLGGRWDAINAWPQFDLGILTSIGIDHTEYLGETELEILREKIQIARPNQAFICRCPAELHPHAAKILRKRRAKFRLWDQMDIDGDCDENVADILDAAVELLVGNQPDWHASKATVSHNSGRMDRRQPGLILDAAHNGPAIDRLVQQLGRDNTSVGTIIFNAQPHKDVASMIRGLQPLFRAGVRLVIPLIQSCCTKDEITSYVAQVADKPSSIEFLELEDCRLKIEQKLLDSSNSTEETLICGSFFVLQTFWPSELEIYPEVINLSI